MHESLQLKEDVLSGPLVSQSQAIEYDFFVCPHLNEIML